MPDVQGDVETALKGIERSLAAAAAKRASLVCFPECYLQGYTRDATTARARALTICEIAERLRRLDAFDGAIVLGAIERDEARLFNSAVVLVRGEVIGAYRKRRPHEGMFDAGADPFVFDIDGVKVGVGICSDARDADLADEIASRSDVIVYPLNNRLPIDTADRWRRRNASILAERAVQTGCWVVSSDVVYDGATERGYGCTAIVDPTGTLRDRVPETRTGIASSRLSEAKRMERATA